MSAQPEAVDSVMLNTEVKLGKEKLISTDASHVFSNKSVSLLHTVKKVSLASVPTILVEGLLYHIWSCSITI